jgi:hypothetical protein
LSTVGRPYRAMAPSCIYIFEKTNNIIQSIMKGKRKDQTTNLSPSKDKKNLFV